MTEKQFTEPPHPYLVEKQDMPYYHYAVTLEDPLKSVRVITTDVPISHYGYLHVARGGKKYDFQFTSIDAGPCFRINGATLFTRFSLGPQNTEYWVKIGTITPIEPVYACWKTMKGETSTVEITKIIPTTPVPETAQPIYFTQTQNNCYTVFQKRPQNYDFSVIGGKIFSPRHGIFRGFLFTQKEVEEALL